MSSLLIGIVALSVLFIAGHALSRALLRRFSVRTALIIGMATAPLAAAMGFPIALLTSGYEPSFLGQGFVGAAPSWGFLLGFLSGFLVGSRRRP